MIRCNNCGLLFNDDAELSKILNVQETDENGDWHTVDRCIYDGEQPMQTDTHHEEVFDGCPYCLTDDFLQDIDKDCEGFTDEQIKAIWDSLTDVPMNENDRLEADWFGFEKGTDREDIWHWFDKHHSKGVYYLLYERD